MKSNLYQLVDNARHGRFLVNPRDEYVGKSIIAYGEWGEAEVRLFTKLLRPGDLVVEAGANIGSHSIPLSQLCGDAGVLFAFEPQRLIFQMLCSNLALNGCINVKAFNAAVGETGGNISVAMLDPTAEMNFGGVSVNARYDVAIGVDAVPLLTIDSLELPKLDMLKADVEGFEMSVLRGAFHTISRFRPAIYVENNDPKDFATYELLENMDYDCYWYLTPVFDPNNYRQSPTDIWAHLGYRVCSLDILALPRMGRWEIDGLIKVDPANPLDVHCLPLDPDFHKDSPRIKRQA